MKARLTVTLEIESSVITYEEIQRVAEVEISSLRNTADFIVRSKLAGVAVPGAEFMDIPPDTRVAVECAIEAVDDGSEEFSRRVREYEEQRTKQALWNGKKALRMLRRFDSEE